MADYKKHAGALDLANILGVKEIEHREHLYHSLNRIGYFWKSATQTWELYTIPDEPPPYDPMRIHVWARPKRIAQLTDSVLAHLCSTGMTIVSRSEPIPCNHPEDFYNLVVMRLMAKFEDD